MSLNVCLIKWIKMRYMPSLLLGMRLVTDSAKQATLAALHARMCLVA